MLTKYVNWGEDKVKLTWICDSELPTGELITSVHGFCFNKEKLLLVNLKHRGWDFPGGHVEKDETPQACMKREAFDEGYVTGHLRLLGHIEVDHSENKNWAECSPYPKVGYQVFFRMNIDQLHEFEAQYEAIERTFIDPQEAMSYYPDWNELYQEILECAMKN